MSKAANKSERAYMGRVAALGCFVCQHIGYGATPAQVHHIGNDGMALRGSHYLVAPLCPRHHDNHSKDGIHGQRQEWKQHGLSEMDALAWTIERLQ
jgi:hypothetical protein